MILWAGEVESCSLRRRWKHLFTCGRGRWEHVAPRRVDNPTVGPLALAPSVAQPSRRGPQLPRSTPTPATGTGVDLCIARRPHMINRFISFVTGRAERAPEAQGEAEAMAGSTRSQRDKIKEFRTVTGASETEAKEKLRVCDWRVNAAVDLYYSEDARNQRGGAPRKADGSTTLFEKYVDKEEGKIMAEGVIQFLQDLSVDPSDPVTLVVAYHMGAETTGEFTKQEFLNGMRAMRCQSLQELQARLGDLRRSLEDPRVFRDVYNFAYSFSCPKGQKVLQLDEACMLWELLMGEQGYPHFQAWLRFLKEHHKRAINKDTWSQFLDFTRNVKTDFSNYDADGGAWPYLIDEFVDFVKKQGK